MNLQNYYDFARTIAYESGNLTLNYFQKNISASYKGDDSPVTVADREAEEFIRRKIDKKFPNHGIVGEEHGKKEDNNSGFTWYIDPIDGTKSFIRGIPLYSVLIGLELNRKIIVGICYFPGLNEMVSAYDGGGCFWNNKPAKVSDENDISRAYVSYTDPYFFQINKKENKLKNIFKNTYYRPGLPDAYGHALVATGRMEIMLDSIMSPWDSGPFPVIMREAGGYFGDWKGKETIHGGEALSTTNTLLSDVLKILNE